MPFAVQTVEAIANGWRHAPKPMTDINVTTTYGLVKDVLNNLRGTSCSFSPNGYLFVGVGLQQYHAAYPNEVTTCIIPPNPGALPPGTVFDFPERNARHSEAVAKYEMYNNVMSAVINHISLSVGEDVVDTYISAHGQTPTPKELLDLIVRDYVRQSSNAQDAEAAEMGMLAKIDIATTGWPTVVEQIERGMIILEMYDVALTPKQVVNKALALLEHTGDALRKDVEKYKRKPSAQQSWEDIKKTFLPLYLKAAARYTAKAQTDFSAAAHAVVGTMPAPAPAPAPPAMAHQIAAGNAVDGMAAAFQAMVLQQQQNQEAIMALIAQQQGGGGGSSGKRYKDNRSYRRGHYYCWTHGHCGHGHGHPEPGWGICKNPAPGHIATATFNNKQGGSTKNCEGWDGRP